MLKHKMSRWDYDVVFYRVFCVTLLAVAFTFTVILTNVFVDIDGLLSNKKKYIPETSPIPDTFIIDEENPTEEPKELISNEDKNYDSEFNPSYRTKRSIESEIIYHAKNPMIKKMITRRLASLLEELDEEEWQKEVKLDITTTKAEVTKTERERLQGIRNEDILHLAMHNILLQGLIGHMDLNDVYKKVHVLVKTFNKRFDNKIPQDEKLNILKTIVNSKEILKDTPDLVKNNNYNEEHKFLDELIKCKELEEQIAKTSLSNEINAKNENQTREGDKVFINTVIEINEKDNRLKASNRSHPKENVEGFIKLIYNGKSIKVNQMHDEFKLQNTSKGKTIHEIEMTSVTNKDRINEEPKDLELNNKNRRHQPNLLLNKVLEEYLKKYSLPNYENLRNSPKVESIKTQRLKRQIKIRYSDNVTSSKLKPLHKEVKKNDDDLYIEIETHFDGKGIKGEKKKEVVRSLIDKIQKALDSDIEEKRNSVEHIKFVKRTQDPIYVQNKVSLNKEKPIEHRLLNPIGKTLEYHEEIAKKLGDTWKKQSHGPKFLSVSKTVNSAEMNEVNIDYASVLRNGIPKRLQTPLNIVADHEDYGTGLLNPNSGNVTLFLKDIDGSGFSIGFSQYEGEPPDKDSMKMFNGLQNLIREYHETYDQDDNIGNESTVNTVNKVNNFVETYHERTKRNVKNLHKIYRRSITELGSNYYNANILKMFFKDNPSFNNYINIFKRHNPKLNLHNGKDNVDTKNNDIQILSTNLSLHEFPITVDERNLSKKLKPSEIFSIANLVNRNRRSVSVKKVSNLKSKIKLNRYLNTKAMANKRVFVKNKRNKRHVNSIRIIARDRPQSKPSQQNSDENIFFISKENAYADKATIIRAVETADKKMNYKNNEYIEEESPFSNIYSIQNPNIQNELTESVYNTAVKSNGLMSKYPHILLDKSSQSKEEIDFDEKKNRINNRPYRIEELPKPTLGEQEIEKTTENNLATVLQDMSVPKVEEVVGAMMPPLTGSNYRITVKMLPKNKTNTNAGFKEVHTSVNKSYDDNGLRYHILLNVSEISKIEKLNKTDKTPDVVQTLSNDLIDQHTQIKALLKLHKKRVDLQLNNLLRESNHLGKIIESNKEYDIDKTLRLLTHDDNDMDSANEEKLMDSVKILQETYTTVSNHHTTAPTTSKPIAVLPSTTEKLLIGKSKIIDTVKQNENVTFEILRKIDTNTQILQSFLQKFAEKLELDNREHNTIKTTEKSALEMKLDLSKDWKSYEVDKNAFFIPNENKNDTIPFVYAYQQSIPMKNKSPSQSLASLVYHGHIHANDVQNFNNNNFKKSAPKIEPKVLVNTDNSKRKFNESKFFLDEINDFKAIPDKDRVISADIKINTTNIV